MPADERLKTNLYGEYILELRTEAERIGCDGFTARYSGMSIARAVLTEAICVSRLRIRVVTRDYIPSLVTQRRDFFSRQNR